MGSILPLELKKTLILVSPTISRIGCKGVLTEDAVGLGFNSNSENEMRIRFYKEDEMLVGILENYSL